MAVRIREVDGDRRHPSQDDRFVRRLAPEIARHHPGRFEMPRRREHVGDARGKRHVQAHALRTRARAPQSEHRVSRSADPVERRFTLRDDVRALQAEDAFVEIHRAFQIGDGEMRFEEPRERSHGWTHVSAWGRGGREERRRQQETGW